MIDWRLASGEWRLAIGEWRVAIGEWLPVRLDREQTKVVTVINELY